MSYKDIMVVTKDAMEDVADAIREKTGGTDPIKVEDLDDAVDSIETGITPTGTIQLTQNGTGIDVTQYAAADVAVPNTYEAADEGKVVSSGALVAQTAKPDTITQNNTYDTTGYNSVTVNVPSALMLGWHEDHWEDAGSWYQLPEASLPTPVGQPALLLVPEALSPAPAAGDVVIACGGGNGGLVIVAGTVYSYENDQLTITIAAMSNA